MYRSLLETLESGATVVTANNRLARTLRQAFEQHQLASGAAAWATPDIVTWPHWLQRLWQESRLRSGQALELTLLEDTATDLLWQQCIAEAEQHRAVVPLKQYARSARKAWKLLNDWNAGNAEEWVSAGLSPDQQAFLRWSGVFRDRCEREGWIDQERIAGLLQTDLAAGLFADLPPVVFAGFDEFTPALQSFCAALRTQGINVITPESDNPAVEYFSSPCATPDDELLAAARWARTRIEQSPGASIGVVIPDLAARAADTRRVFLDIFAPDWRARGVPAGLPLNVSYGRPLADVPVIHAALLLLRLSSDPVEFNDLSLLLRSRWLHGAVEEAAARARLEIRLREKLRSEFSLLETLTDCKRHAPRLAQLIEEILKRSNDRQHQTTHAWSAWLSELLNSAGWPGDGTLDSETWQALQGWNDLLGVFARSGSLLGKISRTEALAGLLHLAQQRLFQPEGTAQGVQVLGVLEAAGHRYDALWVCGMARETWPPAGRSDPFIPLRLQRRLQMPDSSAGRILDYTSQLTRRLMGSAPAVVISWPEELDGEAVGPSSLIADLLTSATPDITDWPLWNENLQAQGQTEVLESDPAPPLQNDPVVRGGATVLNLQAVSPLNAFIEKRLGAFELRRPPTGISALDRGNLIHKALEYFYRAAPNHGAVAAMSLKERRENLRAALEAALKTLALPDNAFMRKLAEFELAQQTGRLDAFIEKDLERPGFRVVEQEELHEVQIGPLHLRLKLDRLDELPDGGTVVIDYKTGMVNRQSWNPDKPRDMQLPLYVTTRVPGAVAVAFARISATGVGYEGAGDPACEIEGVRSPGSKQRVEVKYQYPQSYDVIESWDELRATWEKVLVSLAEQFARGDFRLDPRNPNSARGQFAILSRVYDEGIGLFEDDA